MIWRCPACRGGLAGDSLSLRCTDCGEKYDVVDDIPDLRYPKAADGANDLAFARNILRTATGSGDGEDLVRAFFAIREGKDGWTEADTAFRSRSRCQLRRHCDQRWTDG